MARICREAGARVKENQLLRDLVAADDQRRIEVIANGLPFWGGKQVAIDTTVVSALTGRGMARGRRQGQAEQDKCRRYHELVNGSRCHLRVMAFEVARQWSPTAFTFLQSSSPSQYRVFCAVPRTCCFSSVGLLCWLAPSNGHTRRPSWANHWERHWPEVHVGDLDRAQ